jgi:hypothetical protein
MSGSCLKHRGTGDRNGGGPESAAGAGLGGKAPQRRESAHVTGSHRVNSWLQAGAYYSLLFPNTRRRAGLDGRQHDAAITLRFDINRYWLVKLEGHYMHGTAGLSSSLNGNRPLSTLNPDWALFTVKTTAFF